ncbi:MAG TPA: 16S rRNA processing protein RimM [Clostridiales bacterium]|nr:16S rRNA processing protein RimM [Clostridiales bacterium]
MEDILDIGKITSAHGIQGEVNVFPLTDDLNRFCQLKKITLASSASTFSGDDARTRKMEVRLESVRVHNRMVIIKFEEVSSRDMAESLKGMYLRISRKDAVKLPPDSYFIHDLIGCTVKQKSGNPLGTLKDVLNLPANDLYVVSSREFGEILVPALKKFILSVDIIRKEILVELPDGLVEINARKEKDDGSVSV